MYQFKGFLVVQELTDNTPNMTSTIGELSTYAKTFSKELGYYSNTDHPGVDLVSFLSLMDDAPTIMPVDVQTHLLNICGWLAERSLTGNITGDRNQFISDLLGQWASIIENVQLGDMIPLANNLAFLPEFLDFNLKGLAFDARIKIWFSDPAFRAQYDSYEITVVPPLSNLNDFFQPADVVEGLIADKNMSIRMEEIELAKNGHPPTLVRTEMFNWSNPAEPTRLTPTPWTVIIYGPYGNNIDLIREALVNYVLTHSSHTQEEWALYIPDLFKRTEYVITPLWDRIAIPQESVQRGILSPTIAYKTMLDIAKETAPEYNEAHIAEFLNSSVAMFRSTPFLIVGGPENRDGIHDYMGRFPDYFVTPSTGLDFGRMSPETQNWTLLLSQLLQYAENLTEFSVLPIEFTKLVRNDILYIVVSYQDIQYMVVSQKSYKDLFHPEEDWS